MGGNRRPDLREPEQRQGQLPRQGTQWSPRPQPGVADGREDRAVGRELREALRRDPTRQTGRSRSEKHTAAHLHCQPPDRDQSPGPDCRAHQD
eukprot:46616-Rhodomonas_salina.1